MPFLLGAIATFFGGAFVGSQIDDKLDPIAPAQSSIFNVPSTSKIITYGLMGVGAYYLWHKLRK